MPSVSTVRRSIARALEQPSASDERRDRVSTWESMLSGAGFASPVRALTLPERRAVIGVGGATLGGSGRTPVAIALVAALAERCLRVALVAHAHGARPPHAMVVQPRSSLDDVGDEALIAARALDGRARVVVARTRQEAIDHAAHTHDVLVVDRLLQARPTRLARSLLVVDDRAPWGSGRLLPFGDLAAPRAALLSAADDVVRVGSDEAPNVLAVVREGRKRPVGEIATARLRVGLVTSLARPGRVLDSLAAEGVHPVVHVERDDHARAERSEHRRLVERARAEHIDLWLLCPKSAVHLALGPEGVALEHGVALSREIVDRVTSCVALQHDTR
jgi:tetraacyldisaccharide 4'-kinase